MDNVWLFLALCVDFIMMLLSTLIRAFVVMGAISVGLAVLGIAIPTFGKLYLLALITEIVMSFAYLIIQLVMGIGSDEDAS